MKKTAACFSNMLLLGMILAGLAACTAAYDKYMQEGRDLEKSNQLDNAQKLSTRQLKKQRSKRTAKKNNLRH